MLRLAAAVLLPYCLFAQPFVDYERKVHPILAAKCWSCHSQEKRSGSLSLATLADVLAGGRSGAAIKPGSAATSLLVRRVIGEVQPRMPIGAQALPARGHERAQIMKQQIDAPVAQLVLDLEERGLLDRTLVVLASEFGRDAITEGKLGKEVKDPSRQPDVMSEPKHYGMHRHFTGAGSVLLFGGGIKRGFVYGKTADERPCTTIENPVPVEDLHATIYHALGIAPTQSFVVEKRPLYVTRDGKGKVIQELFA
jgi:hypothetical protein